MKCICRHIASFALNALYLCAALFSPSAQVKVQDPIEVLFILHAPTRSDRAVAVRKHNSLVSLAHVSLGFVGGHVDFNVVEHLFNLGVRRLNCNGVAADGQLSDLDDLGNAAMVKVENIARLQIFYAFIRV